MKKIQTSTLRQQFQKWRTIFRGCMLLLLLPHAVGTKAQALSLDSCLNLALLNNATIQNSTLEIESAKLVKKQAFTKYFPDINATGGGYYAMHPIIEYGISDISNAGVRDLLYTLYQEYGTSIPGLNNNISLFQRGVAAGVTAVQPIYAGGRIVTGNKLAKLGVQAAEYQNEIAKQDIILQTEKSYWMVISLQEKKKTIAQAQTLLDTLYKDVTGACSAGLVTQNDVLKVTLKQNEMTSTLLKVNNGIKLATMALCQSIGIEYSDSLLLTDSLDTKTDEPMSIYKPETEAVENRNETKLLNLNVEATRLQHRMTLGEALPQIGVGAGYVYNNVFEKNAFNGMVFATVQVPLSTWWETAYKLKQQKIKQEEADINRQDLTEKMELQTRQAWNEVEEAYSQVKLSESTVYNAEQNLTLSKQNYSAGLISLSELLEAQTIYRQALDQQCDNKIAYKVKLTRYKQLIL